MYEQILSDLVFRSIITETRLSERQVRLLMWEQWSEGKIRTNYGREVALSDELNAALSALFKLSRGRYVFSSILRKDNILQRLMKHIILAKAY